MRTRREEAQRETNEEKDYDDDDDESFERYDDKNFSRDRRRETGSTGNRHNNTASTKKTRQTRTVWCTPNRVREFTAEALKNPKGEILRDDECKVWLDAFAKTCRNGITLPRVQ